MIEGPRIPGEISGPQPRGCKPRGDGDAETTRSPTPRELPLDELVDERVTVSHKPNPFYVVTSRRLTWLDQDGTDRYSLYVVELAEKRRYLGFIPIWHRTRRESHERQSLYRIGRLFLTTGHVPVGFGR